MKKSRFTDSQIMSILKQAEAGTPVAELCREHGMSNASFYKWRSRFGGMDAYMMTGSKNWKRKTVASKKCMLKSVSRPKLFRKPWQKSGEAIASKADGAKSRQEPKRQRALCLPAVCCERKLLSLPAVTK